MVTVKFQEMEELRDKTCLVVIRVSMRDLKKFLENREEARALSKLNFTIGEIEEGEKYFSQNGTIKWLVFKVKNEMKYLQREVEEIIGISKKEVIVPEESFEELYSTLQQKAVMYTESIALLVNFVLKLLKG